MNKKLIAAAVVAGLAAPMAAQADVNVYGIAQLELANIDNGGAAGSQTTIADSKATRVGVRWSEDLGGGLKALGEFEYASPIENNTGAALAGRQAWLGLKGGFGEVQIGTVLQPYKYSGGVKYDAFVTTTAEARSGHGGMIASWFGQGGYFSNAIAYKKKFGAVKFWAAYSPEERNPVTTPGHAGGKGDLMASLVFGFNGGEAGVAYAKDNNLTTTNSAEGEKNTKIFGKYSFGNNTVLAQYEQSKNATAVDYKVYFLGYQLKLPSMNKLAVQIGQTKLDSGANPKTSYAAVGMFHNFSKKTSVFVTYRKTSPDGAADQKALSVGLREKF